MAPFDDHPAGQGPVPAPPRVNCAHCRAPVSGRRHERALHVCPACGRHAPLTAPQRLATLLDPGSARPIDPEDGPHGPPPSTGSPAHADRLGAARSDTGARRAVVCVRGGIGGRPVVVAALDFRFLGGAPGRDAGALITAAARTSLRRRVPLLLVTPTGGPPTRYEAPPPLRTATTIRALSALDEAGVLTLALITAPTHTAAADALAALADVVIAEPGARLGSTGGDPAPGRAARRRPPVGGRSAEYLLDHGVIDDIVPRSALRPVLGRLLALGSPSSSAEADTAVPADREAAPRPRPAPPDRTPPRAEA